MANASSIFTASRARLATLLGATYKEHTNLFDVKDLSTVSLENGYSIVLLAAREKNPQVNSIFMERKLKVVVTHRTYASVDAGKVVTTLATVYDKEAAIIDSFRLWEDKTIGLLRVMPTAETEIEQLADGEDSFLVNTLNFDILYKN